jgi:FkbM family methyltransferase
MKKFKVENRDGWLWPVNDTMCWEWLQNEKDNPDLVAAYCREKRVIVQAGGNCGFYIKPYAALFETVYTFEPDPQNFYCLINNVDEQNVIKIQACLGNEHKLVGMKVKQKNAGVSRVSEWPGGYPTFMIDDLALEVCDLIHLDIEGYEFFALQGAVETIKRCKPIIALEWLSHGSLYNVKESTILAWLEDLGYKNIGKVYNDMVFSHESIHNTPI